MGESMELIRVRFTESVASLTGQYHAHQEVELPAAAARKYLARGVAVPVESEPETAMETTQPRRRGRPHSRVESR